MDTPLGDLSPVGQNSIGKASHTTVRAARFLHESARITVIISRTSHANSRRLTEITTVRAILILY